VTLTARAAVPGHAGLSIQACGPPWPPPRLRRVTSPPASSRCFLAIPKMLCWPARTACFIARAPRATGPGPDPRVGGGVEVGGGPQGWRGPPRGGVEIGASAPPPPILKRQTGPAQLGPPTKTASGACPSGLEIGRFCCLRIGPMRPTGITGPALSGLVGPTGPQVGSGSLRLNTPEPKSPKEPRFGAG
jgi:hypothetical protein